MDEDGGTPAAKRQKLDLTEEIVVLVGKDACQKKWTVPKTFLTKTSDFLKSCCNGQRQEAQTRVVKLQETTPEAFSAYLQWLYVGELVVSERLEAFVKPKENDELCKEVSREAFSALAELAILADMLIDVTFANAIVDEVLKTANATRFSVRPDVATRIYLSIAGTSGIKRLLVDFFAFVNMGFFKRNQMFFHADLLLDIVSRLREKRDGESIHPAYADRCKYHEHNEKVPKCT